MIVDRQSHKQVLANKAKVKRASQTAVKSVAQNDPVTELQNKINQVKGSLKIALDKQRALYAATKNP